MATREADAVTLLKQDHAAVKALFKEFEDSEDETEQQELADRICKMLTVHTACEEELLYPAAQEALSDNEEDEELVFEAEIEHMSAKQLIAQIESMSSDDERFRAVVKVLSEYINHHVREEEGELFPKLKKTELDLKEMGSALAARKAELMSEMGMSEGTARSMEEDDDEDEQPERSRRSSSTESRVSTRSSRGGSSRRNGSGRSGGSRSGSHRRSAKSRR